MAVGNGMVLRDVLDIKEDMRAGDFKVELSGGFGSADELGRRIEEYVVTPQLADQFSAALGMVRGSLRKGASYAAYLHGSFGSGKSHFLSVLHAVLNGEPAVLGKPRLREVIAEHQDWLPGKRFLMVPYHLVGAANLDSALLGGYVSTVRKLHPDAPTPPVFRSDAMLADARGLREQLGDEAFTRLLNAAANVASTANTASAAASSAGSGDELDELDELRPIGWVEAVSWSAEDLDRAFAAPAGDPLRDRLVSALVSGPMKSYANSVRGDAAAYVPLENGLAAMSRHAASLGYDGLVLFLDELILWLQAHMRDRTFVNDEIMKLVKLIESGEADRPVPVISFVSRQRDLSQLIGADILGSDVKNMEKALEYLEERFTLINLEDRNLPEIIKERVLKPRPGREQALESAFAGAEKFQQQVKDVLLDGEGATHAGWADFRAVYPLSPALLNVLVALSGALQRERTGLKLVQQLLEKNADTRVGRLIPLGDLWDVLVDGTGAAFTDRLHNDSEAAQRFYTKARAWLLAKYRSESHPDFLADDLFVKTLLLGALAPDVPALRRLTGARLAALNHGSVRSRTVPAGHVVIRRMRELQAEFPTEVRADGEADPVFSLHLTDLDIEPLLDAVAEEDKAGVRRLWIRDRLWAAFGVTDTQFVSEREIVWRGTRRTAEFVFGNVRDRSSLPDEQFTVSAPGNVRFVLDYPFDDSDAFPSDDFQRVEQLRTSGQVSQTLVWLPHFFSEQRNAQLGRLMRINFLLERDRLADYTGNFPPDDRVKIRRQLEFGRDTLTKILTDALGEVYGIAAVQDGSVAVEVTEGRHLLSLQPEFPRPQPQAGKSFLDNAVHLADGLFSAVHPKHPDFGPDAKGQLKAVTPAELRTALEWVTRAVDGGGRVEVESHQLRQVKRIVEPMEIGTVHDGPLVLRSDWRTRINQAAARHGETGDLAVEDIRGWIAGDIGWTGLDKLTANLLIAVYALLDDRAWVLHSSPDVAAPDLNAIGPGWALRSQPMPAEEEYATARERAAQLFGIRSQPALFARNVNGLAQQVRLRAEQCEPAVVGIRAALERHAALLGLDGADDDVHVGGRGDGRGGADGSAPRLALLRDAAALLARLTRHRTDNTALVRALAAAPRTVEDKVLATTLSSAPAVLEALDDADWQMLRSVRGLAGRDDSVGDRARRLLGQVRRTARAPENERALAPVLGTIRETGMEIVNAALRVERAAPLVPTPAREAGADGVSLGEHADPVLPARSPEPGAGHRPGPAGGNGYGEGDGWAGTPRSGAGPAGGRRRVIRPGAAEGGLTEAESLLAAELAAVQGEISAFLAAHPGVAVEVSWGAVPTGRDGGNTGSLEAGLATDREEP
ncbi:hypothetical protein [Streptomyces aidingensis]|uniref:PglY protein n=1 Tax=Streptomyces aidingensis TaxID=910347 RepID=A0A1I1SB95_9ACTN|nr:hypothetical protein [Streptomyces aidingensis]SFD43794.1 hypothetical protein SAMN05421773_11562 [Streptomyces aidingensis]